MERDRVAGLTAEIKAQFRLIERVNERLADRVASGLATPSQLDSVAYQIHNLYCSVEDLLKLVASAFENQIGSGGDWHRILLLRMSQPVEGIRPAFLFEDSLEMMNRLLSFRHMVRHAYGTDIELTQLRSNLTAAQQLYKLIETDIEAFLSAIAITED